MRPRRSTLPGNATADKPAIAPDDKSIQSPPLIARMISSLAAGANRQSSVEPGADSAEAARGTASQTTAAAPSDAVAAPSVGAPTTAPAAVGDASVLTADNPKTRIEMPGKFDDACLAGGGRFVVLRIPSESALAVVDLKEAKLAGLIPTGDGETLFTAGQDDVVVVKPADNIVEKFDLATRKLQLTKHHETEQPLTLVAMGYASQGPVLLGSGSRTSSSSTAQFLDLKTLKPLNVEMPPRGMVNFEPETMVRPSAEGTVFGMWRIRVSPTGLDTLTFLGDHAVQTYEHQSVGYVHPNATGDTIFTYRGIYNSLLKSKESRQESEGSPVPVPAVEGPLFVGVATSPAGAAARFS